MGDLPRPGLDPSPALADGILYHLTSREDKALKLYRKYVYGAGYIYVGIYRFYCISSLALTAKNPRAPRCQEDSTTVLLVWYGVAC